MNMAKGCIKRVLYLNGSTNREMAIESVVTSEPIINIYPNPASNTVFITNNSGAQIESCKIYDILGNELNCTFKNENSLDISSLMPGSYFLHIKIQGYENVFKVVKAE